MKKEHKGKNLLQHFPDMVFGNTMLTVAGNIRSGESVMKILEKDVDFVTVGRAGILHHDFPKRVIAEKGFEPIELPFLKSI
ncbi:MAG: hypothetical protein Ct9H90mP6_12290 [Gammaproteobacteria bacterium]|nr:MAG: hypothetical protein Ct9H90mP6_12290 [Gammaproteobacteria bacterium]